MRQRHGLLAVLCGITLLLLFQITAGQSQSQPNKAGDENEEIEPQPLAPPPATATEKVARDMVGETISPSSKEPSQWRPLDTDPPMRPLLLLDGMPPPLPPLPFAEASVAILGDVVKAQPYLTPNRLMLYTELSIRVEEVFSVKPGFNVAVGETLLAVRRGGKARMPDGRVVTIEFMGWRRNMLRGGGRYVLFLMSNNQKTRYEIMTAWGLRSGRVVATQVVGSRAELVKMDAESFLSAVRAAAQ